MAIMTRNFNEYDFGDPAEAAVTVKRKALEFGADAVGIGSIDRWATAPLQMDPKQIMPECKSIIGMVFRVERGSLRGIEEGTYFSNYSAMGYGGITYLYMPMTVINLSKFIEDQGYEAIPMGHQSDWRGIDADGYAIRNYSRPVAPGKPQPDIMIQLRIAAFLCGLGEIGFSKMFLSPQFGPRCRVGIVGSGPLPHVDGRRAASAERGLLEEQHLRSFVVGRDAGPEPGSAVPDHQDVRLVVPGRGHPAGRRLLSLRRAARKCRSSRGACCGERRSLEKAAP